MRIIAGIWRGRSIDAPARQGTRPTADRVRETLFSMLVSRIGSFEELRVADLFAGSGALGFEALSRGASSATFVERDANASAAFRRNAEKLGALDKVRIILGSVLDLPPCEPFDLVFADPPYRSGLATSLVATLRASGWLAPGCWLSIETAKGDAVDPGEMAVAATREVGKARLTLLRQP
jgi:16S rRNA (guanine966-N2)-methyltransferase